MRAEVTVEFQASLFASCEFDYDRQIAEHPLTPAGLSATLVFE